VWDVFVYLSSHLHRQYIKGGVSQAFPGAFPDNRLILKQNALRVESDVNPLVEGKIHLQPKGFLAQAVLPFTWNWCRGPFLK
jgi:hypothetical protein